MTYLSFFAQGNPSFPPFAGSTKVFQSLLSRITLIAIMLLSGLGNYALAQYSETFPIPEKGIIMGPCPGGTSASCGVTDFAGVNWDINGNFTGFDAVSGAEDYIKTIGGVLEIGGDIDEELCWESPELDISAVAGGVSYSVDLTWLSQDNADYIDVEHQIDGGSWIQKPNQFPVAGGGTHTIDYTTTANNGSGTITETGLVGSTLSFRVCADTNTSGESTTIDNVSIPEVGVVIASSVSFTALNDLCIDAGIQTGLSGGLPTGGVYSGPGVTDNSGTYSFNPATAGAGIHTITYTVGGDSAMDNVVVSFLPTVTFTAPGDVCVSNGVLSNEGGGMPSGAGGVYSGTGVSDDGNGLTYDFDPAAAGVGTHTITYTYTDVNGCSSSASDNVEVSALPAVSFTAPADVCIDADVQVDLGGASPNLGSGEIGMYTGAGVTDGGDGSYDFSPLVAGTGVKTISYTYSLPYGLDIEQSDGAECLSTFNQSLLAQSFIPNTDEICGAAVYISDDEEGEGDVTISLWDQLPADGGTMLATGTVTASSETFANVQWSSVAVTIGTTYYLVFEGTNTALCPGGATNNPYPDGQIFLQSGGGFVNFDYAFRTYNCSGLACATSVSDDVEVFALPVVGFTAPADLCITAGVQTGLGGGTPPQGTAAGDMGVYSGDGVADDSNGMTYSFDPASAGVGTHTLTYTYTDNNGCVASASDDVEVFAPQPVTLTIPPSQDTLCLDAGLTVVANAGSPAGGVYSGPGVTDDGNGMSFTFDPSGAGAGLHLITYTVAGVCTGMFTDFIHVLDLPTVTFTAPADLCIDAGNQSGQSGAMPIGGVYSGPGVTDGLDGMTYSFDPATAGVGVHAITYTITDDNGCTGTGTDMVEVFAIPTVGFTALPDLCLNAGIQINQDGGSPGISGSTSDTGIYSGLGVTDTGDASDITAYSFDPATAGVGTHTITYTYTDANGCTDSASDDVEVFALPTVTFTATAPDLCIEDAVQTGLGGGVPTGGAYSGTGVTDDGNGTSFSFDPTASAPAGGNVTITYAFSDNNGCSESATSDIFVAPTCYCFSGDNMFTGVIDNNWDLAGNWSAGCIPASPYAGTLTIMKDVSTTTLPALPSGAFMLTGDLIVQGGFTFQHDGGEEFAVDGVISVLVGGALRNTSPLSTTGGMTNEGNYSGIGLTGNFINNGVIIIGGN